MGGEVAMRPYVLVSVAMSADGYIDDASGRRLVLSDEADLDQVDELRAGSDAILVGAGTVRADDPRLAVRSAARRDRRRALGRPAGPVKVTITASGDLDPAARFFAEPQVGSLVYASAAVAGQLRQRLDGMATVVSLPPQTAGQPEHAGLAWVLADLSARGIGRLMIEGGASILGQVLSAGLADELRLAIAPLLIADDAAPRLVSGARAASRMRLAEVGRAGDMAVLRYLPGRPQTA
jgi:5-amino-6-(5-phosphoribosylamino)uracil reductase